MKPQTAALLESIADWSLHYTPLVALDLPHGLLLDVTGATHLFGGERALLDRARASLSKQGFAVQGAIAGSAAAARALARYRDRAIVPPGEEARAMAPLPVEALALDPAVTHAFRHAGFKTIGQIATRKRSELTARFGAAMVFALDMRAWVVRRSRSRRACRCPITWPSGFLPSRWSRTTPFSKRLRGLAAIARNAARPNAAKVRGVSKPCSSAPTARCEELPSRREQPTRDADAIARLFRERLDALADPLDPGFGFDLIRLCADRAERCETRNGAFAARRERGKGDRIPRRSRSPRASVRIACWCSGRTTRTSPKPRPSRCLRKARKNRNSRGKRSAEKAEAPRRPLRLFAKPEPIATIADTPEAPPVRFRWRRAWHEVVLAEGPERIAMEWWRDQTPQPTRDYFRVEDANGRRFWLYRDGLYGSETAAPRWFMHGLFA